MFIIRDLRARARVTATEASVMADVSPTTWRVYEASPDAVSPPVRQRCDAAVQRMVDLARAHEAA